MLCLKMWKSTLSLLTEKKDNCLPVLTRILKRHGHFGGLSKCESHSCKKAKVQSEKCTSKFHLFKVSMDKAI